MSAYVLGVWIGILSPEVGTLDKVPESRKKDWQKLYRSVKFGSQMPTPAYNGAEKEE